MMLKMLNPCVSVPSFGKLAIVIQPKAKKRGSGNMMPTSVVACETFPLWLILKGNNPGEVFSLPAY